MNSDRVSSLALPSYIVFLVHGTFARGAEWTRPASKLSQRLQEELGNEAILKRFEWSGQNSAVARYVGGRKLQGRLRSSLRRHPEAKHIVIAHSHGGNVALRAVTLPELSSVRVVCLSTPFLRATPRYLGSFSMTRTYAAFQAGLLVLGIVAVNKTHASILLLGLIAGVLTSLTFWSIERAQKHIKRMEKLLNYEVSPAIDALILRGIADEASAALSTSQFASWLFNRLLIILNRFYDLALRSTETLLRSKVCVLFLVLGTLFVVTIFLWGFGILNVGSLMGVSWSSQYFGKLLNSATIILYLVGLLFLLGGIGQLILSALLLPVALFLSINSIPAFGKDMVFVGLSWDLSAETTPSGNWRVTRIEPDQSAPLMLRHSCTYEQDNAISAVVTWIKGAPVAAIG